MAFSTVSQMMLTSLPQVLRCICSLAGQLLCLFPARFLPPFLAVVSYLLKLCFAKDMPLDKKISEKD